MTTSKLILLADLTPVSPIGPKWDQMVRKYEPRGQCSFYIENDKGIQRCKRDAVAWTFYSIKKTRGENGRICLPSPKHRLTFERTCEAHSRAPGHYIEKPRNKDDLYRVLSHLMSKPWFSGRCHQWTSLPEAFAQVSDFKFGVYWNWGSVAFQDVLRGWPKSMNGLHGGLNVATTSIYRLGTDVSVVTTVNDEREFIEAFSEAFSSLESKSDRVRAMEAGFEILAKMRGYKANVQARMILAAGRWPHPSEEPLVEIGRTAAGIVVPDRS